MARTCRKRPRKVELNFLGVYNGARATCSGTVEGASDVKFEATQIYSQENTLAADARCAVAKLKADKLSKGLDSGLRPRHSPHLDLLAQSQCKTIQVTVASSKSTAATTSAIAIQSGPLRRNRAMYRCGKARAGEKVERYQTDSSETAVLLRSDLTEISLK